MKLYEFEGKSLLQEVKIPTPIGDVAHNFEEAAIAADRIGYPVVVKSQVLQGGRGKAGAVKFARNQDGLSRCVHGLLGLKIGVEKVDRLLIEKQLSIAREFYLGISFDPQSAMPLLMLSPHGGMDIEAVAQQDPEKLIKKQLDPLARPSLDHMAAMASTIGLSGEMQVRVSDILLKLVGFYFQVEAITAEINPLIIDPQGKGWAADAKVEIDDAALFRSKAVEKLKRNRQIADPLEAEADAAGVSYVRLNNQGNIGLIAGGAGLGMATMDTVYFYGGLPANFLDLGGMATPEKTAAALEVVLKTPGVEGVFINAFGGINNCREMAEGLVKVIEERDPQQVIVVKMRGHSQDEGWSLLEAKNIPIVRHGTTEDGIVLLLEEMKQKGAGTGGHPDR
ncbi:MAG: acetate--CoA ligase family protein [Desulfobacterales bacterium]|jgi:succinyl-CoA synthetase beta subunit